MSLRIFNNLNSAVAQRYLGNNSDRLADAVAKVAAGKRILRSSDDSAGLAISQSLQSDTRTLRQGAKNLSDARQMLKVAESSLNEFSGITIRLRELASQSATGTIGQTEREVIQLEFNALRSEMDRISKTTEYNGINLLDGTLGSDSSKQPVIQIGLSSSDSERINLSQEIDMKEISTKTLGIDKLNVNTSEEAVASMAVLKIALSKINGERAKIGATQNRLDISQNTLNTSIESLMQAYSTISDTDMAEELAQLTRQQILVNSATAMVGQANLIPQNVLSLFQN